MSWKELLSSINEEVHAEPAIQKKPKERMLFERIAREVIDDRVDEVDLAGLAQKMGIAKPAQQAAKKVGEVVKKTGEVVKGGWRKLAGKIKEVAMRGFRMGVAIGKTAAGKFVLFSKSGNILTAEAEHAEYKRVASGKKLLTLTYAVPHGHIPLHISDRLTRGFGTDLTPDGDGIFYAFDFKNSPVIEGVDYLASELLTEAEEEEEKEKKAVEEPDELEKPENTTDDIDTQMEVDRLVFSSFAGEGAKALSDSEIKTYKIAPVEVTYEDFTKEIVELLNRVKEGNVLKGSKIKNLAIYAPTGWGKTEIIGKAAKMMKFHFFPLELQKVAIELLSGFPYLDDVKAADESTKEDRIKRAIKIVKMAPSQFLPPAGSPDNWLLFFDEFNRADTEKMSAVMNLLLTGELGGAAELVRDGKEEAKIEKYRLPKKIVIVLAMNTGQQKNIADATNNVKDLDIATLERVHRILHGKYHAVSWFRSFAALPYFSETESGQKMMTLSRIPPIIMNYIQDVMKTKGGLDPEAPFLLPIKVATGEPGMGGGERTSSPRSWTVIADDMLERGIEQWNSLTPEGKSRFKETAKQIKDDVAKKWPALKKKDPDTPEEPPKEIEPYMFAAWMQDAGNQIRLLAQESPELGDEGREYIGKMIRSFIKRGKQKISEEDMLFNYKAVRSQVKVLAESGFGGKAALLAKFYKTLIKYKNEKAILEYMEKNAIPVLSKQGMIEQLFQTFKAMYKDLDFDADDYIAFTHLIEAAAKKGNNELMLQLHRKLAAKWEVYLENLKKRIQTKSQVEKELEKLSGGKKGGEPSEEPEEKTEARMRKFLKGMRLE